MNDELIFSPELESFLKEGDLSSAKSSSKNLSQILPSPQEYKNSKKGLLRGLEDFATVKGEVSVSMSRTLRNRTWAYSKLLDKLKPLNFEANKICVEIQTHLSKVYESFAQLSKCSESISKVYQRTAVSSQMSSIYTNISSSLDKWSKIKKAESTNFFENIALMYSLSVQEEIGLQLLVTERNSYSETYKLKKLNLDTKKEKSFGSRSLKTWQVDQNAIDVPLTELFEDKELAKKYMFAKVRLFFLTIGN